MDVFVPGESLIAFCHANQGVRSTSYNHLLGTVIESSYPNAFRAVAQTGQGKSCPPAAYKR